MDKTIQEYYKNASSDAMCVLARIFDLIPEAIASLRQWSQFWCEWGGIYVMRQNKIKQLDSGQCERIKNKVSKMTRLMQYACSTVDLIARLISYLNRVDMISQIWRSKTKYDKIRYNKIHCDVSESTRRVMINLMQCNLLDAIQSEVVPRSSRM